MKTTEVLKLFFKLKGREIYRARKNLLIVLLTIIGLPIVICLCGTIISLPYYINPKFFDSILGLLDISFRTDMEVWRKSLFFAGYFLCLLVILLFIVTPIVLISKWFRANWIKAKKILEREEGKKESWKNNDSNLFLRGGK